MIKAKGYAALSATKDLVPIEFERKEPLAHELLIDILYCGICHADIHQSKNEYGRTRYPLVPGHEIVGRVKTAGSAVSKFKTGDLVGVGYFIDSCGRCSSCAEHEEQFCENGITPTQNGMRADGTVTKGGYANCIVVNENYVLHVAESLEPAGVAPLLCAGITAYSPLNYWNIGAGHKVGVLGLGGVGHMVVKFASSFGAEVTVLSTSAEKKDSALALGAAHFVSTSSEENMANLSGTLDFIVDTVSAKHDYNRYLNLLVKDGTMILLGVPPDAPQLAAHMLISKRRRLVGSFIGGISETQEMLDYCAANNITADVEVTTPASVNEAFERTLKGDVKYRFVIDMKKL